jgi:hypothetical protein
MRLKLFLLSQFFSFLLHSQPSGYVLGTQVCWNFNGRDHGYFKAAGNGERHILVSFTGNGETSCSNYQNQAPQKWLNDFGLNWNGKTVRGVGDTIVWEVFTITNLSIGSATYATDVNYFFQNIVQVDTTLKQRIHIQGLSGGVGRLWDFLCNAGNHNSPYRNVFGTTISMSGVNVSSYGGTIGGVASNKKHWVWHGLADANPGTPVSASTNLHGLLGSANKRITLQTGGSHSNNTWDSALSLKNNSYQTNRWIWMVTDTTLAAGFAPSIVSESDSINVCGNATGIFKVKALNANSYNWQYAVANTNNWVNIIGQFGESGFNTDSLNIPNLLVNNWNAYIIRCQINNTFGTTNAYPKLITINAVPNISVIGDTVCGGGNVSANGILTANTSTGAIINWFATPTSTTSLNKGNSFMVSNSNTTTFYAEANSIRINQVGIADNTGGGSQQSSTNYNIFDVFTTCIIKDVLVYPGAVGNIVLDLRDSGGILLNSVTYAVSSTNPIVVPLNFTVMPGVNYRLGQGTGSVSMFRNTAGVSYPYTIQDVLSIKGSNFGSAFYYFAYSWNVESALCKSARVPVVFTVNPLPSVTAMATSSAVCAGGTVILTGGGASTYAWNNGVTNGVSFIPASSITYAVMGTDANGCSNTDSVNITVNALPIVTASASLDTLCAGQTTILTGGGAVSYVWDNGATNGVPITPSSTTTYTVTGTDANTCSNTAAQLIIVNANPVVSLTAPISTLCTGTPVTLTGLPAGGIYTVESGASSALLGNLFNAPTTGSYTIAYTSTNAANCSDSAQFNFNVNCVLGLDNTIINNSSFTISPNPSSGSFAINRSVEGNCTIEMINELGQVVYRNRMNGLSKNIDVQNLTAGIYYLRIVYGNTSQVKRLSIAK